MTPLQGELAHTRNTNRIGIENSFSFSKFFC